MKECARACVCVRERGIVGMCLREIETCLKGVCRWKRASGRGNGIEQFSIVL